MTSPIIPSHRPLTVVIPTLNEEHVLGETLLHVKDGAIGHPRVVVVDGGSTDDTRRIAHEHGASFQHVDGGRGAQLNAGAALAMAGGDVLFLHADTHVPPGYDVALASALALPRTSGGAFRLRIRDARGLLRVVQWGANIRARFFGRPYGDQGIFVRRDVFDSVGGFAAMPFLEDYDFVRRLSRRGSIRIAVGLPVSTDPRRWLALGVVRTTLLNQAIILGYSIGVPVPRLRNWYRGALRRAEAN